MELSVLGSASLNDLDADFSVSVDAEAPMPLLGLFFDYYFTPKWSAGINGQFFCPGFGRRYLFLLRNRDEPEAKHGILGV